MTIKLSEIFIPNPNQRIYPKETLFDLKLHDNFVRALADRLAVFYSENNGVESNLCFANSLDVRPEYRTAFEKIDVIHYICALLPAENANLETDEVLLPENAAAFWALADVGREKFQRRC